MSWTTIHGDPGRKKKKEEEPKKKKEVAKGVGGKKKEEAGGADRALVVPDRCDFSNYLSEPNEKTFPASDEPKFFLGMHAICLWEDDFGGVSGYAHFGCVSGERA